MIQVPTIQLTKSEYMRLIRNKMFSSGSESVICKSKRHDTLYKFLDYECKYERPTIYQNKRHKLRHIYNMPNLQFSVLPVSFINVDGQFAGYEMTFDRNDRTVSQLELTFEQKIDYLKKVRNILDYYAEQGIVYGDVKSRNTLMNRRTRQVKFCDIDNIQIAGYSIDVATPELLGFIKKRGIIDKTADIYMYNLLTLEQIAYPGTSYQDILDNLEEGSYPHDFSKEAYRTLDSMLYPKSFTGETIVQYAKKCS